MSVKASNTILAMHSIREMTKQRQQAKQALEDGHPEAYESFRYLMKKVWIAVVICLVGAFGVVGLTIVTMNPFVFVVGFALTIVATITVAFGIRKLPKAQPWVEYAREIKLQEKEEAKARPLKEKIVVAVIAIVLTCFVMRSEILALFDQIATDRYWIEQGEAYSKAKKDVKKSKELMDKTNRDIEDAVGKIVDTTKPKEKQEIILDEPEREADSAESTYSSGKEAQGRDSGRVDDGFSGAQRDDVDVLSDEVKSSLNGVADSVAKIRESMNAINEINKGE